MNWFLYTRLGQWLSQLFSGGWCLIQKDDPRFVVTCYDNSLHYEGDSSAMPDKGVVGNQRNAWKDWIIFRITSAAHSANSFIVIDTYNGQRMACFKRKEKSVIFAIRAGHEAGIIRIGIRNNYYAADDNNLRPEFLARWREGDPWLLEIKQDKPLFI